MQLKNTRRKNRRRNNPSGTKGSANVLCLLLVVVGVVGRVVDSCIVGGCSGDDHIYNHKLCAELGTTLVYLGCCD